MRCRPISGTAVACCWQLGCIGCQGQFCWAAQRCVGAAAPAIQGGRLLLVEGARPTRRTLRRWVCRQSTLGVVCWDFVVWEWKNFAC